MKIVVVGLPLFAQRLVENLERFDSSNSYVFLNTYYNKWDKLKAIFHVPRADVLFSINGSLTQSKVFDLAFRKHVPVVMNWVGTDVQLAQEGVKSNNFLENYRSNSIHFCEVSWIQEELKEIGIDAKIQNFAAFPKQFETTPFSEERLNILTYINDSRKEFYGIKEVLILAERFQECHFYIAGTKAESYGPLPANVTALGWVENMETYFAKCQVTLRFPEHDGLATFVLESLARGKHVLYKYDFDHCIYTPTLETMEDELKNLLVAFREKALCPNEAGVEFIKKNFNEEHIFGSLLQELKLVKKNGANGTR